MFAKRLLTVAVLLPLFAAALLLLPQMAWALLLLPLLGMAGWEWGGLAGYSTGSRYGYAALIGASGAVLLYFSSAPLVAVVVWALSAAFWLLVAPLWLGARSRIRNPLALGAAGWIALVPMWLALVELQPTPWALLLILSIVWIADTAAYAAGKRWGRHKLAPVVSPGKSWEGVAGAAVAVAVYYVLLWWVVPDGSRYFDAAYGLLVFAVVFVLSIIGDLFESLMKRQAGVKDSGQLLPGHGGLLDRIDGLTSTMPLAALALYYR
jgi:phosphatidate cytidylyltransferase